jgi:CheY-like chemotaxis protein
VILLVVDDERPVMQLCVTVLEIQGHVVEGFTRGEEFLERLAAVTPDLIVVDYKMPGLAGLEVVRQARARMPDLRVVMITGHAAPAVVDEAAAAGVNAVLLKPFTPSELAHTVAATLATPAASTRQR